MGSYRLTSPNPTDPVTRCWEGNENHEEHAPPQTLEVCEKKSNESSFQEKTFFSKHKNPTNKNAGNDGEMAFFFIKKIYKQTLVEKEYIMLLWVKNGNHLPEFLRGEPL